MMSMKCLVLIMLIGILFSLVTAPGNWTTKELELDTMSEASSEPENDSQYVDD